LGKEINEMGSVNDQPDPSIVRGEKSWNYFYLFLGFAITIESTVIDMMSPVVFPCNLLSPVRTGTKAYPGRPSIPSGRFNLAVALAGPAHGPQTVEDGRFDHWPSR
jgi:hypothetical protein